MLSRRDVLKAGAIAATGVASSTTSEAVETFGNPTETFDANRLETLPPWAFDLELFISPTPRPTAVGDYDLIDGVKHVFGDDDQVPVGQCFHGVALEWGGAPAHWEKFFQCTPTAGLSADVRRKSWKEKQAGFGKIKNYVMGGKDIGNWGHFPIKCHKLHITSKLVDLVPGAPKTRVYAYGGMVPGPTLRLRHGQPMVVRYQNHLEAEVSVHLHGGHTPSHSDGFPTFYVLQGKSRDYFYPNIVPMKLDGSGPDQAEAQSTMWYHDHGMDATGYNVSKGLAGFALFFSEDELRLIAEGVLPGLGPKSCEDPELMGLGNADELEDPDRPGFYRYGKEPYHNPYDIPLVLQDKVIDLATGQIAFDTAGHNGYLGDMLFVNGVPWPHLEVENRKYRFRILNGSNARVYRLRLLKEDDYIKARDEGMNQDELDAASIPFLRIGKDSWLWDKARTINNCVLAMANRADIVVDFKNVAQHVVENESASFYLVNTMPQKDGRGPKQKLQDPGDPRVLPLPFDVGNNKFAELDHPIPLMRFDVQGPPVSHDASVEEGTELIERHEIPDEDVKVVREFIFERGKGAWQINGRFYDPTISNASPAIGTAEEWVLRNGGGGWWHPIHIHLESHQVVQYLKDFQADNVIDVSDPPARNRLDRLVDVTNSMEAGAKVAYHDTQVLGPNTVVRIRLRFRTFHGPFVFHCHNLEHEDMRMMFNFEPKPAGEGSPDPDIDQANVAPDSRTHGNDITLQNLTEHENMLPPVGELAWEFPPVPYSPVKDHGENVIPPVEQKPLP